MAKRPPLMPHEERRKLIEAAVPKVTRIPSDKRWAGCAIHELEVFFNQHFGASRRPKYEDDTYAEATDQYEDELLAVVEDV